MNPLNGNSLDASLRVLVVGYQADLTGCETDRRRTHVLKGHRHQRNRDLLTGREQLVHFTLGARLASRHLRRQRLEVVGRFAHRREDDGHLIPGFLRANDPSRDGANLVRPGHARPAEFHYYDAHYESFKSVVHKSRTPLSCRGGGNWNKISKDRSPAKKVLGAAGEFAHATRI